MIAKYHTQRVDYLVRNEELAHCACNWYGIRSGCVIGKELGNHVNDNFTLRKEMCTCYGCGYTKHIKAYCRNKKAGKTSGGRPGKDGGNIVLARGECPSNKKSPCDKRVYTLVIGDL